MNLTQLANSYLQSAMQLKQRISELRQLQQQFPEHDYQERITLLSMEYSQLLDIYTYLSNYYQPQKGGTLFE
ncbi:MAG: hypothetical protein ACOX6U_10265 [Oscillospiraceae bacterium]|jgi:hypothetical protein